MLVRDYFFSRRFSKFAHPLAATAAFQLRKGQKGKNAARVSLRRNIPMNVAVEPLAQLTLVCYRTFSVA
jgi:hypothetical protein